MAHHHSATITVPRHAEPRGHDHHTNGHDCVQAHGDHRGRHQPHEHQEANHQASSLGLAVALAFLFGYAMTLYPLRRAGMAWGTALGLAFASDTLSMTTMELVDNAIMVMVPGAMDAGLPDPLFWGSLVLSLLLAGVAAFPVNRWLIARGKGHALVHGQHCH